MMSTLGAANFGVSTFFASCHPNDKCGANGLPLTPNSIKVLGRFQHLTTLQHSHLCSYIDIVRGKHERLIVVSEHFEENLAQRMMTKHFASESSMLELAYQILDGLVYLNSNSISHRNLSPENILFDNEGKVKIANFGMNYMTGIGIDVAYPIGLPKYTAPEVLCRNPVKVEECTDIASQVQLGPKEDTWSLGLILLEALTVQVLWSSLSLQQTFRKILNFVISDFHPLDIILQEHGQEHITKELSKDAEDFLRQCLEVSPRKRPLPSQLIKHSVFRHRAKEKVICRNAFKFLDTSETLKYLELSLCKESMQNQGDDHLSERHKEEVYYLWRLAGGDLEAILKREGMIKTRPPITLIPCFFISNGEWFGQKRDQSELLDNTIINLSQDQLRQRLRDIDEAAYYPLLEDEKESSTGLPTSPSSGDLSQTATLPLVIREKDVEYQFHRIILYERLLKGYPYKKAHIWREARVDIPPLYRSQIWAALLEVEGIIQRRYDAIDKETPTPTDRQIEVDIPRCHQYHELLSSPDAHAKFKRILKAWVISHPEYVYWQGLDSLCAPFLALSFNNEALAFACLDAFIPKYLNKFFLKDNSSVIQEYLSVFSHLIAYHDPDLSNHLDRIGFIPDPRKVDYLLLTASSKNSWNSVNLYAIPWFLTMYAHVFPLHKIVHLWDTLLLGNSSFPLCIGVAILQQLRDQLLSYVFNDCILLFSDMPEIDIERCVQDSIRIFCSTPKSATYRQHARSSKKAWHQESRPKVSYYSRDYNNQTPNELSMEPVSIADLKAAKYPQISAEDLIELAEFSGPANSRSPTKRTQSSKPKLLLIDIRSSEEFKRGTIPGSINIPFQSAFNTEKELNPCPAVQTLNLHKTQVKVVISSRGNHASAFANNLVALGYPRVCVLQKGIDVMRPTGLLTVPPADI